MPEGGVQVIVITILVVGVFIYDVLQDIAKAIREKR
jgi:hypothetical protein